MYDAIVLAGGRGRRLGGVDKAALDLGGRPLLDRALAATAQAARTVVVGPPRDLPASVLQTQEDPPGGGPVAGLAAGLRLVRASLVVVLACDQPFVTTATVDSLLAVLAAADRSDGARLVDEQGQPQPLSAVYRTAPLQAAVAALETVAGTPVRRLVADLRMLNVTADRGQAWDCDTWADVARARERVDAPCTETIAMEEA